MIPNRIGFLGMYDSTNLEAKSFPNDIAPFLCSRFDDLNVPFININAGEAQQ